jgi:hypothetical protein
VFDVEHLLESYRSQHAIALDERGKTGSGESVRRRTPCGESPTAASRRVRALTLLSCVGRGTTRRTALKRTKVFDVEHLLMRSDATDALAPTHADGAGNVFEVEQIWLVVGSKVG